MRNACGALLPIEQLRKALADALDRAKSHGIAVAP
jgi:hypothetical protein